jgi:hypothetical protein
MKFTNKPQVFDESEILRAVQPTYIFNKQRMDTLEREIDNMEEARDPIEAPTVRYCTPSSSP